MTSKTNLYSKSIEIIKDGQDQSGAYTASPTFSQYNYCWLRDGSYIAHAMDCVGEFQSSRRYFKWIMNVLDRYRIKYQDLERKLSLGILPKNNEFLHTRYFLNGLEDPEDNGWGNFQIDGYGTWLWALYEHINMTEDRAFLDECIPGINLTCRYLQKTYLIPCYDLWEENPNYLHTYSLGAVFGGLQSAANLAKDFKVNIGIENLENTTQEIRDYILEHGVINNHFNKHLISVNNPGMPTTDASLLALSTPYRVFPETTQVFGNTLSQIEKELRDGTGGVYRYRKDTYYGGGEWVLLAGWLGWHYARTGDIDAALELKSWIEEQADAEYQLPEQVSGKLLFPERYQEWVDDWGEVAKPLLWSHAMYLILVAEINKVQDQA